MHVKTAEATRKVLPWEKYKLHIRALDSLYIVLYFLIYIKHQAEKW